MENEYCVKLCFKHPDEETQEIYGLITKEDDFFIYFETRNGSYRFSKSNVISIRQTDIVFSKNKGYDYDNYKKY